MKVRLFAVIALVVATHHAARAQDPPPDSEPPPEEVTPAPAEPAPAPAEAPPAVAALAPAAPAAFGAQGQLVLSVDLPFMNEGPQFAIVHDNTTMNGPTSTRIVVQPSVDYFVSPGFSIGLQLGFDHASFSSNATLPSGAGLAVNSANGDTTLSVEARIGYELPIADTVSIWPRVGLGYTHTSTSYVYSSAFTGYIVPLSFTVPFLWHPGHHFFVGAGPAFVTQLVNKGQGVSEPKTTAYGVTALIGGAIAAL